jgi:hypothetical protein
MSEFQACILFEKPWESAGNGMLWFPSKIMHASKIKDTTALEVCNKIRSPLIERVSNTHFWHDTGCGVRKGPQSSFTAWHLVRLECCLPMRRGPSSLPIRHSTSLNSAVTELYFRTMLHTYSAAIRARSLHLYKSRQMSSLTTPVYTSATPLIARTQCQCC